MKNRKKRVILMSIILIIITSLIYLFVMKTSKTNETYENVSSMLVITEKFVEDHEFFIKAYDPNSSQENIEIMELDSEDIYNLLMLNEEYLCTYTIMPNDEFRVDEIKLPED